MKNDRESSQKSQALRVLLVEDSVRDAKLCARQLEQAGYELSMDVVSSRQEFERALASKLYDVVLADYRLPNWSGLDALEALHQQRTDVPFILVTGTLGEETAVECIKKGVSDFVLKDRLGRLPVALERALEQRAAAEERKRTQALLHLRTSALEAAANGIVITDRDGRIVWVNPAFSLLTGYRSEEVIGKSTRILKSGKQDQVFYRDLWQTILAGSVWRGEFINRRKDGSLYEEEGTITPIRDQGGVITHFVHVKQDVTERNASEEVLRQSEERFRALVTASSDVVYRMSPDWSEMRQLHGQRFIADTNAPSRDWLQKYIHPADQPRVLAAINEAIRTSSLFELEHRVLRVDGSLGWTFSRAVPLKNAHGKIIEWFGTARDVTGRKQAEEDLRESERQFRTLANAIPQLCWMANPDGWIFWYNQRWYEYTGTTPEQMEGWGWQSVHDPEVLAGVLKEWKASIATGKPFDMTFPLRGADGLFRPFLTRVMPVQDESGKVARWFGTNTDISEQRAIEEGLRRAFEQRQSALDAAELGAWEYRFETGDVFWDDRCGKMFGFSAGNQIRYEEARARIHPEDCSRVEETMKKAIAGVDGGTYHPEFRVVWPDGSVHWLASHGRVYFEGEGANRHAVRFIGTHADISQRKQLEQVLQRNVELENANFAKDRFLASMSHELRTPLNAILGFTGTLLMRLPGPLTDGQTKQLETIRSSAKHLLALITDLLDLSKIESGKVALTIERVVLQSLLEETYTTVRPLVEKKALELRTVAPPDEMMLETDRRAVSQILLNLVSNAIKYTDQGEVRIVLDRASMNGKSYMRFSVHDTGIGIHPQDQPKLFQYFTQVGRDSHRERESAGLGLYLSRKLAELLGGQIGCRSEYGKGSTFTLCLPEGGLDNSE